MPSDVLSKVLHNLCSKGPLRLRFVLFVSKRLYLAAINDASLWTTISFDAEFISHFAGRSVKQANSFIAQCLLYSDSLPLRLSIQDLDQFDGDRLLGHLRSFRNSKYRGFTRCSSLVWSYSPTASFRKIADLFPKEFPSLQSISLSGFDDQEDGSRFPDCPALVKMEILDHLEPYPSFWGTNFAHVTTLSFGNSHTSRWRDFDFTTLSLFPMLHNLTLFTVNKTRKLDGFDSQRPIQFKNLQILRAHGDIPSEIFTELVAPSLEELHIKGDAKNFTPVAAILYSPGLLCSHLYALLPEAVAMNEPEWATDLSRLVQACAKLETLHIPKWMEVECRTFLNGSDIILHVV